MRVAVTGVGFIGTSLLEHLLGVDGIEPFGIDRVRPKESWAAKLTERCDLLDYRELESVLRWRKPDAVVHTAAQARVDPSLIDPLGTYDLNVEGTLNVMRACKAVGIKFLVCFSSEAVYGKARVYPSPENNDFAPANPYAASKVAIDVLGQQFDRVLPTCVVRSGMGWGPGSNPREQVVSKFIMKALSGEALKFPIGDIAHPTRDLNHVGDFCRGIGSILGKKARGVYNLSGGREYTVLEIAQRIIEAVGKGRIEYDPAFSYRENEEGFRTFLDVSKAKNELGHEPRNHLEGKPLLDTIAWYKEHGDTYFR